MAGAWAPDDGWRATSRGRSSSQSWDCARSRLPQAAYEFWLGGDFIKNDEPQGNQVFSPMKRVIPLVADAMRRAMDETGEAEALLGQHHGRRSLRDVRARRLHSRDVRPRCRQGRVSGRRLRRRAGDDHDGASSVSQPVPALPPGRPRDDHVAECEARLRPPTCWPRCRACRGRAGSTWVRWATARWRGRRTIAPSPTSSSATSIRGRRTTSTGMACKPTTPIISAA